jgi:hypothetical protein
VAISTAMKLLVAAMNRLRLIASRQPVSFHSSAYQWNENPSGGKSM